MKPFLCQQYSIHHDIAFCPSLCMVVESHPNHVTTVIQNLVKCWYDSILIKIIKSKFIYFVEGGGVCSIIEVCIFEWHTQIPLLQHVMVAVANLSLWSRGHLSTSLNDLYPPKWPNQMASVLKINIICFYIRISKFKHIEINQVCNTSHA